MGIDEAGRGPTLGPMVYGSAFFAVEDEQRVRKMGFNDSKQLTEAKRDQLWAELQECKFIGWNIRVLDAKFISEGMLRRHQKYNLNAMSHDAAIGLVRGVLDAGVNLRYLYVDTVGDPERCTPALRTRKAPVLNHPVAARPLQEACRLPTMQTVCSSVARAPRHVVAQTRRSSPTSSRRCRWWWRRRPIPNSSSSPPPPSARRCRAICCYITGHATTTECALTASGGVAIRATRTRSAGSSRICTPCLAGPI